VPESAPVSAPVPEPESNSDSVPAVRHAAVLGSPIAHSLSPVLHRAAYRRLGLTGWRYDAFDVTEAQLPGFIAGLDRGSWAGLSLTMPLKRTILPLLAEIGETARSVDAVNTVLVRPDGELRGENTDVPGLIAALAERGVASAESAAVLGGGATAASTLAALSALVTGPVSIYLRSPARAAELEPVAAHHRLDLRVRPWSAAAEAFDQDLVVNTTPAGAADELADTLPAKVATLFDVLYHPWPTPLAAAWTAHGGTVLGGQDLLIHQAALQVELMTAAAIPTKLDRTDLLAAMRSALAGGG
jgi:shikimate dehydrogenase